MHAVSRDQPSQTHTGQRRGNSQSQTRKRFGIALMLFVLTDAAAASSKTVQWVQTWSASPMTIVAFLQKPARKLKAQTLREKVRVSVGGAGLQIRVSNEFGTKPLRIGAASIALSDSAAGTRTTSLRRLTFGKSQSSVIPPGAPALSDPIDMAVPDFAELEIRLYLPDEVALETFHAPNPGDTSLPADTSVSTAGDFTLQGTLPGETPLDSRPFLTGVDVAVVAPTKVVVALGDSITQGQTHESWPDKFARRAAAAKNINGRVTIVNAGIGGNRILRDGIGISAQARFDRDVLAVPGVTHVIVLEGLNDIGWPGAKLGEIELADPAEEPSVQDLIAGYMQLIARAHSRQLKIYGATLPPFEGKTSTWGYYTPAKEQIRQEINAWIRASGAFDGVIDFEKALRDPVAPQRIRAEYSDDSLHPNVAGSKVMADAVDLNLFK